MCIISTCFHSHYHVQTAPSFPTRPSSASSLLTVPGPLLPLCCAASLLLDVVGLRLALPFHLPSLFNTVDVLDGVSLDDRLREVPREPGPHHNGRTSPTSMSLFSPFGLYGELHLLLLEDGHCPNTRWTRRHSRRRDPGSHSGSIDMLNSEAHSSTYLRRHVPGQPVPEEERMCHHPNLCSLPDVLHGIRTSMG